MNDEQFRNARYNKGKMSKWERTLLTLLEVSPGDKRTKLMSTFSKEIEDIVSRYGRF